MFTLLYESGRSAKVVVLESSALRQVGMYGHIHTILKDSKCVSNGCLLFALDPKSWVCGHGTIVPDMDRLIGVSLWKYFVFA